MQARIVELAEKVLPNWLQYPPKQIYKHITNIQKRRKAHNSKRRLFWELAGGLGGAFLIFVRPIRGTLHFAIENNFDVSPLVSDLGALSFLVITGVVVGNQTSKYILREMNRRKTGHTNTAFNDLEQPELDALYNQWEIKPDLASLIVKYLRTKILAAKTRIKTADSDTVNVDKVEKHTTKVMLEAFRTAGYKEHYRDILPIIKFFHAELAALEKEIDAVDRDIAIAQTKPSPKTLNRMVSQYALNKKPADELLNSPAETKQHPPKEKTKARTKVKQLSKAMAGEKKALEKQSFLLRGFIAGLQGRDLTPPVPTPSPSDERKSGERAVEMERVEVVIAQVARVEVPAKVDVGVGVEPEPEREESDLLDFNRPSI